MSDETTDRFASVGLALHLLTALSSIILAVSAMLMFAMTPNGLRTWRFLFELVHPGVRIWWSVFT